MQNEMESNVPQKTDRDGVLEGAAVKPEINKKSEGRSEFVNPPTEEKPKDRTTREVVEALIEKLKSQ